VTLKTGRQSQRKLSEIYHRNPLHQSTMIHSAALFQGQVVRKDFAGLQSKLPVPQINLRANFHNDENLDRQRLHDTEPA